VSDAYSAARILKPVYFAISRLRQGRGRRAVSVIGFDSEQDTKAVEPMLFQFSKDGDESDVELVEIPHDGDPLALFMSYVHRTCTNKHTEYVILGWNMQYEFTQLFGGLPSEITSEPEFVLDYTLNEPGSESTSYTIRVANDKRYFVKIRNENTHRTITFADGMAFYVTSLDKAAAMLGLGRKLKVLTKRFTRADLTSSTFLAYARQDAYLTRMIGENILELHDKYDVTTCLTAPQFASKVFRHHFLSGTVPPPDPDMEQAGLFAYHGGKNGFYLGGPASLANVYAYDITSAYPEAMRQLPDVEKSEWHWTLGYEPGVAALWNIRAQYKSCRWRGLMEHGNRWHKTGEIAGWTTSYELDTALALGEIELLDAEGWVMRGEPGGALVEYVDTFFDMKRKAKGALREAAKLFLNSLYGKFFQKVPLGVVGSYALDDDGEYKLDSYVLTDPSQQFDWQAGGLYHPPIAALITGFVRAKIHRLEHKYDAIMTSTDGFFALRPPDPDDIGTDLGKLTVERGHLMIWRERLYYFVPSRLDAIANGGKHKVKFALHGFRGKLRDLRRLPLSPGRYEYRANAMITNKLARNAYHGERYRPGAFVDLPFTLDLSAPNAPP
jgi:hypothetical protein